MLPALAEEFDACVVGCFVGREDGILEGYAPPDMPELVSEYSRAYAAYDPLHEAKSAARTAIMLPTRLVTRRTFHASHAYADLYRPWKIEHVAVLQTREHGAGGDGLGLVIGRSGRQGDFSSENVRALRRLLPSLQVVSERLLEAERACRRVDALTLLAEALEKDASTLLLDADGQLVWSSVGARRDFDPGACAVLLAEAARTLCRGKNATTTGLTLEFAGTRASVALSLLENADARGPFVLVRLRNLGTPDVLERWAATAGLTKSEVRVMCALCDGGTNVEIGRRLFISAATVRTHIDHIFRKLDVSSRLQAVLVAQRGAKLR
jgi:DNA-binding CsgD family transcriptional regulator